MRKHTQYRIACIIAFFLIHAISYPLYANNKYERFFLPLDSAIFQHEEYKAILELQIRDLKRQRDRLSNTGDIYLINKMLFSKYSYYICDSALAYLDYNEKIAIEENKTEWLYDIYLNRAGIYIQTGMLNAAGTEFDKMDIHKIPDSYRARYYILRVYFLEEVALFSGTSTPKEYYEYGAQISKYAITDEESIWGLLWSGTDQNDKIIELLKKEYEKNINLNDIRAGNNALVISRTYEQMNNEEEQIRYLCLSGLSDIKHVNRDPTSLLELVSYLSAIGDSERAFVYLNHVLQGQAFYPARISGSQMAQYMKRIFEETQQRSEDERHKTSVYLSWLSIGVVVLIILVIIISLFIRKLHKQSKNITEINDQLRMNLSDLSKTKEELVKSNRKMKKVTEEILETNKKLKESNYIKEEYIGYIFSACSNYLTKMDEFRQNINRKMKTGKAEEVLRMTQPTNSFLNNEVKELNQTFDSTFLSIYPDFVEDFNSLLRKEERMVLHGSEDLNTELRIYALVWLGINNSSKIANLLHISSQTVYNARMKMRNKSVIDGEKFAEAVQALGREKIGS